LLAPAFAAAPKLPGIGAQMQVFVDAQEVAGVVTCVTTKDGIVHLETTGLADIAGKKPMQADTMFWLKSMTKPVTGVAVMMMVEEGRLKVEDPIAKYIPAFAGLRTPSGKPANLTIAQILTHTSGLGEGPVDAAGKSDLGGRTLADLIPQFLASPMLYEPGAKWRYCQSGINTAARLVEIVSGMPFDEFVQQRICGPLGMKDTTFYPTERQLPRIATVYARNQAGQLEAEPPRADILSHDRPPMGNGGLYATAGDYARFCQMLLNGGTLEGKHYLKPATIKLMASNHTGDLKAGFTPGCSWGYICGVTMEPQGVTSMLSPGTYGHGGAFGTQAWIDPVKGAAYILMIQRSNLATSYRNGDESAIRGNFQQAAVAAMAK